MSGKALERFGSSVKDLGESRCRILRLYGAKQHFQQPRPPLLGGGRILSIVLLRRAKKSRAASVDGCTVKEGYASGEFGVCGSREKFLKISGAELGEQFGGTREFGCCEFLRAHRCPGPLKNAVQDLRQHCRGNLLPFSSLAP